VRATPCSRPFATGALGVVVGLAVVAAACASEPTARPPAGPGLPVVPDAVVDVAFADLDSFGRLLRLASQATVLPAPLAQLGGPELADAGLAAPVVVMLRRDRGDVIIASAVGDAARLRAALTLIGSNTGLRVQRRVGAVDAVVDDAGDVAALVRVGEREAFAWWAPEDPWAAAALLEALASGSVATRRVAPLEGVKVTVSALPGVRGASGSLVVADDEVAAELAVEVDEEAAGVLRGLDAPAPDLACAVEEGAALAVRVPPIVDVPGGTRGIDSDDGDDADSLLARGLAAVPDAFAGRVVVALHPAAADVVADLGDRLTWGAVAVAGRPRAGRRAELEAALPPATSMRAVAGRSVRTTRAPGDRTWHDVVAVADDDVFAVGVGVGDPIDRVAAGVRCPDGGRRVLTWDGARGRAMLRRLAPVIERATGGVRSLEDLLPAPAVALLALDRLEVDSAGLRAHTSQPVLDVSIRVRPARLR
jgi:hypothetical protein